MNLLWNLLLHAVIISTIVGLLITVASSASKINHESETMIRYIALITGFLIYLAFKTAGVSVPDFINQLIPTSENESKHSLVLSLWALLAGLIFSFIYTLAIKFGPNAIARLFILIATFLLATYSDLYLSSLSKKVLQGELNVHLLPNLAFTVGMALYFILFVKSLPEIKHSDIIPSEKTTPGT